MTNRTLGRTLGVLALCAAAAGAVPAAAAPGVEPAASAATAAPPVLGIVQDTAGTPLPNARVVITEIGRATTTAGDGSFSFRNLRAGTYHLDATLLGYAPAHAVVTVPDDGPPVQVRITMVPTPLALSGLNVTASPTAEDPLRLTQSTVQLTGKELGRNLRASVAQTLADQPGISARYAGPGASAPVVRGLSGERVLVLQDGGRVADLSSTSADHGLSVDPLAATQIEVVRGPASLLYGNNALAGVVNVITNDIPTAVPAHVEGYVATQGESVNPGGAASASVVFPVGNELALTLRGGGRSVDDVRTGDGLQLENTSFRNLHGTAGLGWIGAGATAGIAYRGYAFEYGLPFAEEDEEEHEGEEPGEPHGHGHEGIDIEGIRHELTGRATMNLGTRNVSYIRADGTAQWYTHDEVEPSGEVGTTFRLNTQTLNLTGRTQFGRVTGAVGASALLKQYDPTGEEALTPSASSNGFGVFAFQEVPLGRLDPEEEHVPRLQFGARYDFYGIDTDDGGEKFGPGQSRDFGNVSGSVGLNVPFGHDFSLSGSVARAFRAPTVEELFSNAFHAALGTFDVGNPELEEETNLGADVVFRARSAGINAQASGFYNRIDRYIAPDVVGERTIVDEDGETIVVPLNVFRQGDATLRGVEGQVEATVARNWVVGAMGDWIRGEFEGGEPLPYMPAARLGGSVRWDDPHYSAGLEVRHAFAQDEVPEGELATGAYTLVGLSAGATFIRGGLVHSITLRADNLLDESYRDAASRIKAFAPSPGRNLTLVYRVLF